MPSVARTGREYLTWTVTTKPAVTGAPDVAFVARGGSLVGATWVLSEWVDAGTTNTKGETVRDARVLVAGPDAPTAATPGHSLAVGDYRSYIRFSDNPETVIREAPDWVSVR